MLVREVADSNEGADKLVALVQFLLGRAEDTDAQKTISVDAFTKLAANMGISITPETLSDISQRPPLANIIDNIEGDEIRFRGSEIAPAGMTVDQARLTVDNMAKRAIDIK